MYIQKIQYLPDFVSTFKYELFQVFVCANNNGSLVNSLFGVKILIPVPVLFQGFNFTLLSIVSSNFSCLVNLNNCFNMVCISTI